MLETREVAHFGDQRHRRERIDAAQATQASHHRLVLLLFSLLGDLLVERRHTSERLFERCEVLGEHRLRQRLLEALRTKPLPVGERPVLRFPEDPSVAQEKLQYVMAMTKDVLTSILAAADQVAQGFFGLRRHPNRRQLARAKESLAIDTPGRPCA